MAFLGGSYFVFYFLTPASMLETLGVKDAHEYISYGFVVVGSVAFGVGILNLILIHGLAILRLRQGWGYSVALLVGLGAMTFLSVADWRGDIEIASKRRALQTLSAFAKRIESDKAGGIETKMSYEERKELLKTESHKLLTKISSEVSAICERKSYPECADANSELTQALATGAQDRFQNIEQSIVPLYAREKESSVTSHLFSLLNEGFFIALGSSMFALLAFYITSAAFRAFRVRNAESALLMGAALVVMLGQIALGPKLWSGFPELRLWLLRWPNSAAFRAISIGASVAGFVMSIRLWLSIGTEKEHE